MNESEEGPQRWNRLDGFAAIRLFPKRTVLFLAFGILAVTALRQFALPESDVVEWLSWIATALIFPAAAATTYASARRRPRDGESTSGPKRVA